MKRLFILFFAGYGMGTMACRYALAAEPVQPQAPPAFVEGPEDPFLQRMVQRIVDRRMDERKHEFQPTDEDMEKAMNTAINGGVSADMGAGGWFALAIAKAVWKAFRIAVRVVLFEDILSLARTYWYYLAAGAAALAGWIEWRARSAAKRAVGKPNA